MPGGTTTSTATVLVKRLDRLLAVLGGVVGATVMVVIGGTLLVSLVLRYLTGSSLAFATELPSYAFPWLVCGGIVAAAGTGGHMAVDFVVMRLPAAMRRVVEIITWAIIVVALVLVVLASWRLMASFQGQGTPILGWPAVGSYLAFPISLALLTVHAAVRLLATLAGVDTHIDATESAAPGLRRVTA